MDIVDNYFATPSPLYVVYHGFKVVSIFYCIWLVYVIGHFFFKLIEANKIDFGLPFVDRFIMAFLVGVSVIGIVMLILGYLGLYYAYTRFCG